jgi:hypothetical protein
MDKRYIVTITNTSDAAQARIVVVDQKRSKVVHDSVTSNELVDGMKELFMTQYGNEVMFLKKDETAPPPKPEHPHE